MSSALRLFWPNFYKALIAVLAAGIFLAWASVAFAQDAPVVAAPSDQGSILPMLRDSLTAALLAVLTGALAWLSRRADSWFGAKIDLNSTLDSLHWQQYVKDAADDAFAYAQNRIMPPEKISNLEEKASFLGAAYRFIKAHNNDIVAYADKNGNGVIDLLEALLAKRVSLPSAPEEPPMQQGFMASPPVRTKLRPMPPVPPVPPSRRKQPGAGVFQ